MTLKHLQIFILVYENQSITRTAEQLHIAQPSISLAIKELESYYNIKLFDRMKRQLFPTAIATEFYQYAKHIISLVSEMEKGIQNWEDSGSIKIGSSVTIGNHLLPDILVALRKIHPKINFSIEVNNSETIEQMVIENRIDIGLIETEPTNDNLSSIPFMTDYLSTIVNISNPLATTKKVNLNDLVNYNYLMREDGSSVDRLVNSIFITNQLPINITMKSISTLAIVKAVEADLGVATLPYKLVKQAIDNQRVIEMNVPQLNIKRTYNIIYHKNKYLSKVAFDFFEICKNLGDLQEKHSI